MIHGSKIGAPLGDGQVVAHDGPWSPTKNLKVIFRTIETSNQESLVQVNKLTPPLKLPQFPNFWFQHIVRKGFAKNP